MVTGASTRCTFPSSTRISSAFSQRDLTSDSFKVPHFFSCSIHLSISEPIPITLLEGIGYRAAPGSAIQQDQTSTDACRARKQQTTVQAMPRMWLYLLSSCRAGAPVLGQSELSYESQVSGAANGSSQLATHSEGRTHFGGNQAQVWMIETTQ